jgi:hypothetical protein
MTTNQPSLARLAKTTAIAVVVAGVLLVTFVLPAEYGIDPTGAGRLLGLTAIASPPEPVADDGEALSNPDAAELVPTMKGPVGEYPRPYKFDVYEVVLAPKETIEYKYHLETGAEMFYAWTATKPVIYEFHGERSGLVSEGGPSSESYDKQTRDRSSGSFRAPFIGIHGWYWENTSAEPVTVRLISSGFYNSAVIIPPTGARTMRDLQSLDALPRPAPPTPPTPPPPK